MVKPIITRTTPRTIGVIPKCRRRGRDDGGWQYHSPVSSHYPITVEGGARGPFDGMEWWMGSIVVWRWDSDWERLEVAVLGLGCLTVVVGLG